MGEEKNNCCDIGKAQGVKIYGSVKVGPKGQIIIPKDIRDTLNINTGDILISFSKHDKAFGFIKAGDIDVFVDYVKKEMEVMKEMEKVDAYINHAEKDIDLLKKLAKNDLKK